MRMVLQKAGKAIAGANVIQASQEAVIERQQAQIEALAPSKPRKRVAVDPITRFANIDTIYTAQQESKRIELEREEKGLIWDAQKAANAVAAKNLADMCFEWQL